MIKIWFSQPIMFEIIKNVLILIIISNVKCLIYLKLNDEYTLVIKSDGRLKVS